MSARPVTVGGSGGRSGRGRVAAILSLALAVGLAGCGDDTGDGGDPEVNDALAAACEAQVGVLTGFADVLRSVPGLSRFSSPSEEDSARLRSAYDAHVTSPMAALVVNAPDEIADEVGRVSATGAEFRLTGDPFTLEDESFTRDTDRIDGYLHENCAGTRATVDAVEYAYRSLSGTLPAGAVRLELRNTGDEAHNLVVFARQPGVTESFDELLTLGGEERQSKLALVDLTLTDPGQTGYLVADLAAGDYVAICTIGKGTTDYGDPSGGEPHFTLGMRQEVKVG